MNNENTPVDVGVVGVGSMGQHHARAYSELSNANLVGVFDTDSDRAAEIAAKHGQMPSNSTNCLKTLQQCQSSSPQNITLRSLNSVWQPVSHR